MGSDGSVMAKATSRVGIIEIQAKPAAAENGGPDFGFSELIGSARGRRC
jgi:hypothetical protein